MLSDKYNLSQPGARSVICVIQVALWNSVVNIIKCDRMIEKTENSHIHFCGVVLSVGRLKASHVSRIHLGGSEVESFGWKQTGITSLWMVEFCGSVKILALSFL